MAYPIVFGDKKKVRTTTLATRLIDIRTEVLTREVSGNLGKFSREKHSGGIRKRTSSNRCSPSTAGQRSSVGWSDATAAKWLFLAKTPSGCYITDSHQSYQRNSFISRPCSSPALISHYCGAQIDTADDLQCLWLPTHTVLLSLRMKFESLDQKKGQ